MSRVFPGSTFTGGKYEPEEEERTVDGEEMKTTSERTGRMAKKRSERLGGATRLEEFVLKVVDAEAVIDEVIAERDRARLALSLANATKYEDPCALGYE